MENAKNIDIDNEDAKTECILNFGNGNKRVAKIAIVEESSVLKELLDSDATTAPEIDMYILEITWEGWQIVSTVLEAGECGFSVDNQRIPLKRQLGNSKLSRVFWGSQSDEKSLPFETPDGEVKFALISFVDGMVDKLNIKWMRKLLAMYIATKLNEIIENGMSDRYTTEICKKLGLEESKVVTPTLEQISQIRVRFPDLFPRLQL